MSKKTRIVSAAVVMALVVAATIVLERRAPSPVATLETGRALDSSTWEEALPPVEMRYTISDPQARDAWRVGWLREASLASPTTEDRLFNSAWARAQDELAGAAPMSPEDWRSAGAAARRELEDGSVVVLPDPAEEAEPLSVNHPRAFLEWEAGWEEEAERTGLILQEDYPSHIAWEDFVAGFSGRIQEKGLDPALIRVPAREWRKWGRLTRQLAEYAEEGGHLPEEGELSL